MLELGNWLQTYLRGTLFGRFSYWSQRNIHGLCESFMALFFIQRIEEVTLLTGFIFDKVVRGAVD